VSLSKNLANRRNLWGAPVLERGQAEVIGRPGLSCGSGFTDRGAERNPPRLAVREWV